jgi:hypothetical protein
VAVAVTDDKPRCGLRCARVTDKGICDRCNRLTADDLWNMPVLEGEVRERLYEAQSNAMGDRVSGSRERPLGFSVDALSLVGPINNPALPDRFDARDQVGPLPMLDTLWGWVRVVAEDRHLTYPAPTITAVAAFLLAQHDVWTVKQPWADEYAFEVRGCAHEARRLCGLYDAPVDVKIGIVCKRDACSSLGLFAIPGENRVECPTCGNLLTRSEYDDWVKTNAVFEEQKLKAKGKTA